MKASMDNSILHLLVAKLKEKRGRWAKVGQNEQVRTGL